MGDLLKVSTSKMKDDHDKMESLADNLVANSNKIAELINELSLYQSGVAYEEFKKTMAKGRESINDLIEFLHHYLDDFKEASEVYKNSEDNVFSKISKVHIL